MLNFHGWLDRHFKKGISFSVFFRIWLAIAFVVFFIGITSFYALEKTLAPSAKRVVEDVLVDSSRLLAVMVAEDMAKGRPINARLDGAFDETFFNHPTKDHLPIWYDQKQKSQFHIYVTDDAGQVIYDSLGRSVGADFSRWNDVYLTLKGKYGARSTDLNGASVMYVASPIKHDGRLIGVVSVGKPTHTLAPYLKASYQELLKILAQSVLLSLGISALVAMWLRHSIHRINRYTQSLGETIRPHFYLGRELNELAGGIHQMKVELENKAYITDYAHTLTHELKSPLSAIRASSELLTGQMPDEDRVFFATLITEQSERLSALVDKLLTLAKLEDPSFKLKKSPVSLNTLTDTCLAHATAKLQEKALHTHTLGTGTVLADAFWLAQALENITENAIAHADTFLLFILSDTHLTLVNDGTPLPSFVVERAFERYFSFSHDDEKKGTGLGLPLVATIMNAHDGTATLKNATLGEFLPKTAHPIPLPNLTKDSPVIALVLKFPA